MEKLLFNEKVAYKGAGGFRQAVAVDCYARGTMEYTAGICARVIAITPFSKKGPAACEVEIPLKQIGEFVALMGAASLANHNGKSRFEQWTKENEGEDDLYESALMTAYETGSRDVKARLAAAFPELFLSI